MVSCTTCKTWASASSNHGVSPGLWQPENKMFVYHPSKRLYWFSLAQDGSLREYNLIGVLMGLAVYNSIILDVHFPAICFR